MNLPTIASLRGFYAAGGSPVEAAEAALARIDAFADPALFITRVPAADVRARAAALAAEGPQGRALFGIPFVVKDNIAAAGIAMTAACPDFSHVPADDAPVVARLLEAGAILLGKVNLDQFATGLNGSRSPYGTPRNAVVPSHIPGGSSSGSATAVAAGIAAFSLGTDTAGSGRVPAAAQELVGLKPSLGLIPTRGVVPACRSLDCVSVFAHTIADAAEVLRVAAGPDAQDPYSRTAPAHWQPVSAPQPAWRLAVPHEKELVFETPEDAKRFDAALARAEAIGATITRVTIKPLLAVARRLYDGAWVAERTSALLDRVQQNPGSLHAVTRAILEDGLERRTVDAFLDFHAVAEARLVSRAIFAAADALLLPTHPGLPSLEEMAAHPIAANSRLGTYTNFVNLCDLAGIAVPNGRREDGIPCGVTFLAPAFTEGRISALAAAFTGEPLPTPAVAADEVELFCIGAHMAGLPLNPQVLGHGGRFLRTATTAPLYRLYAMGHRPGMVRAEGGGSVAGEVWALPAASVGPFLAEIPPPLGFGRVTLSDGTTPLGFLCEAAGAEGQPEITALGGWRAYLATKG